MNKKLIETVKKKLSEESSRLEKQIADLQGHNRPKNGSEGVEWMEVCTKEDENASEVATYQENLSLEQNLQASLGEIKIALEKIAAGTYGVCSVCARDIEQKRLEVFPAATQHTDCRTNSATV